MATKSIWQVEYDDLVSGATMWWDLPDPVSARIDSTNFGEMHGNIISYTWQWEWSGKPDKGPVEYQIDVTNRMVTNQQTMHTRRLRHIMAEADLIVDEVDAS